MLDCAVCVVDAIELVIHFVMLNKLTPFEYLNNINHSR